MLFAVIASAFVALGWAQMATRACDNTGLGQTKIQGSGTNYWMWFAKTDPDSSDITTYVWQTFQPGMCQPADILGGSYQMMECVENGMGDEVAHVTYYTEGTCNEDNKVGEWTYNETEVFVTGMQHTGWPMDYWCNGTDEYASIKIAVDSSCTVGATFHVATGPCLVAGTSNIMDNGCDYDNFYWQFYLPSPTFGAGPQCMDDYLCTRYHVTRDCQIMISEEDPTNLAGLDVYAQLLDCGADDGKDDDDDSTESGSITATVSLLALAVLAFFHN